MNRSAAGERDRRSRLPPLGDLRFQIWRDVNDVAPNTPISPPHVKYAGLEAFSFWVAFVAGLTERKGRPMKWYTVYTVPS